MARLSFKQNKRGTFSMKTSIKNVVRKRPGRPATGQDPVTAIRLSPELRANVDKWAATQEGRTQPLRSHPPLGRAGAEGEEKLMTGGWPMRKERELIKLARAKRSAKQIADKLEASLSQIFKIASPSGSTSVPNRPNSIVGVGAGRRLVEFG
jgi:hypothetical protein